MDAVLRMRMTEGSSGYGIFIMLLELLRDSEDLKTSYDPAVIAWALHESDIDRLRRVCENYDLFKQTDNGELYCPWLTDIMSEHTERHQKLSEAGKKSAAARKRNSNHLETTPPPYAQGGSNHVGNLDQQTILDNNREERPQQTMDFAALVSGERVYSEESIKTIGRSVCTKFDLDYETLKNLSSKGHNLNAVGDVAKHFKLNVDQFTALKIATGDARIGSKELIALVEAFNHCKQSQFMPKYPYEYLMSRIVAAHNTNHGQEN